MIAECMGQNPWMYMKTISRVNKKTRANRQYELGLMYANGMVVKKNVRQAIEWYRKAAEGGNQEALDALKELAENKDYSEETKANAQYALGSLYTNSEGVEKGVSKGMEWYRKAAIWGHEKALKALMEEKLLVAAIKETGKEEWSAFLYGSDNEVTEEKRDNQTVALISDTFSGPDEGTEEVCVSKDNLFTKNNTPSPSSSPPPPPPYF